MNQKALPGDAKRQKHTTGGIPRWSPTLVLVARFSAYVWQSGRDAQFSLTYGRMCKEEMNMCSCLFYTKRRSLAQNFRQIGIGPGLLAKYHLSPNL